MAISKTQVQVGLNPSFCPSLQRNVLFTYRGISYQLLTNEHADQTVAALANTWVKRNVLTASSGITVDEFLPVAASYVSEAVTAGLSVVAISPEKRLVVGFFIWEDCLDTKFESIGTDKLQAEDSMLEALYSKVLKGVSLTRSQFSHGTFGGVVDGFEGLGITSKLLVASEMLSYYRGYMGVIVESVAMESQHICDKLGWSVGGRLNFDDFRYHSTYPFKGVEGLPVDATLNYKVFDHGDGLRPRTLRASATLMDTEALTYQVLDHSCVDQLLPLVVSTITTQDLLVRCLGISASDFQPIAREALLDYAEQGHSIVALDKFTRRPMGFILCEDLSNCIAQAQCPPSGAWDSYYQVSQTLLGAADACKRGEVLCINYAGVDRGCQGGGLATQLVECSMRLASRRRFTAMCAETLSKASQAVCTKLGFATVSSLHIRSFQPSGAHSQPPFAAISSEAPPYVLLQGRSLPHHPIAPNAPRPSVAEQSHQVKARARVTSAQPADMLSSLLPVLRRSKL